ncbi:MAG: beta-ketoacyl-ACP synthase III [Lachnospiraceae bacterium]|nr:beta-ketoacyl-ACP synthase III [Lachnospiraceae bacterium]
MQGIKIVATGRALPRKIVTNDDLSRLVDTNDEWIRTRTGIRQRHFCEEETCQSLAIEAAFQAVERAGINKQEIGTVIVATATADNVFPSVACMVQNALGLSKEVLAFDLSAACSGFLYGLGVCHSVLLNQKKKYALLIGSEQMSRILDMEDRSTCVLFGDGAGAAVITLDENEFYQKAWSDGNSEALSCKGAGYDNQYLSMEGSKVFKFAVKVIAQGIEEILAESGKTIGEIDYIVCHQANERIIDHVSRKYEGVKFYKNMDRYANTSAASIPIALDEMYEKGMLKEGMQVILVGFGAGFTWSSALLTI